MDLQSNSNNYNQSENNYDKEIDLKEIINFFIRNYLIILPFTFVFLILGFRESNKQKDIWQGQFQIVLQEQSSSQPLNISGYNFGRVRNLISSKGSSNLKTQIGILKSQSVLKPVFEFFKEGKSQKGINVESLKYKNWRKDSLVLELEPGTTILNIKYKDTDKNFILPVLEKLSQIYQNYTSVQFNRKLNKTKSYLEKQIEEYDLKSQNSIIELQKFSIENNLVFPRKTFSGNSETKKNISENPNNFDNYLFLASPAENLRLDINEVNQKLDLLKNNNDRNRLLIIASQIKGNLIIKNNIEDINELQQGLNTNNRIFTDKDPIIKNLKKSEMVAFNNLRNNVINFLEQELLILNRAQDSYKRPKEVIAKYRELFGKAQRNSVTLQNLEDQLHVNNLQIAEGQDPWELITSPTLDDEILGPIRSLIILQKVLYGLIVGSLISMAIEIKKNVIRSETKILNILGIKLLQKLDLEKSIQWEEDIDLLIKGPLEDKKNRDIAIIHKGEINEFYLNKISKKFQNALNDRNLFLTQDITKAKDFTNKILLIQKGTISKSELINFKNKLTLLETELIGLILLD